MRTVVRDERIFFSSSTTRTGGRDGIILNASARQRRNRRTTELWRGQRAATPRSPLARFMFRRFQISSSFSSASCLEIILRIELLFQAQIPPALFLRKV